MFLQGPPQNPLGDLVISLSQIHKAQVDHISSTPGVLPLGSFLTTCSLDPFPTALIKSNLPAISSLIRAVNFVCVCVSFLDGVVLVDKEYVEDQKGKKIQTNTGKYFFKKCFVAMIC